MESRERFLRIAIYSGILIKTMQGLKLEVTPPHPVIGHKVEIKCKVNHPEKYANVASKQSCDMHWSWPSHGSTGKNMGMVTYRTQNAGLPLWSTVTIFKFGKYTQGTYSCWMSCPGDSIVQSASVSLNTTGYENDTSEMVNYFIGFFVFFLVGMLTFTSFCACRAMRNAQASARRCSRNADQEHGDHRDVYLPPTKHSRWQGKPPTYDSLNVDSELSGQSTSTTSLETTPIESPPEAAVGAEESSSQGEELRVPTYDEALRILQQHGLSCDVSVEPMPPGYTDVVIDSETASPCDSGVVGS